MQTTKTESQGVKNAPLVKVPIKLYYMYNVDDDVVGVMSGSSGLMR